MIKQKNHVLKVHRTSSQVNKKQKQTSFLEEKKPNHNMQMYELSRARAALIGCIKRIKNIYVNNFEPEDDPFKLYVNTKLTDFSLRSITGMQQSESELSNSMIAELEKEEAKIAIKCTDPLAEVLMEEKRIQKSEIKKLIIDHLPESHAEIINLFLEEYKNGEGSVFDFKLISAIKKRYFQHLDKDLKYETKRVYVNKTLSFFEKIGIITISRGKTIKDRNQKIITLAKIVRFTDKAIRLIEISANPYLAKSQVLIRKRKGFFNGITPGKKNMSYNEKTIAKLLIGLGIGGELYDLYKFPPNIVAKGCELAIIGKKMFLKKYNYSEMFKSNFETNFKHMVNFKFLITNPINYIKYICEELTKHSIPDIYVY